MRWEEMTPEQAAVYREMLRRGLSQRRTRPQARRGATRKRIAAAGLGVVVLLGVALALLGGLSLDPLLRVRDVRIQIHGPGAVTPEQVQTQLALAPGVTFTGLDWATALARVQALPRVGWARLSYGWFHRLDVQVEERRAAAVLIAADGRAFEVAADGVVMEPAGRTLADLPLLTWEGSNPRGWPEPGRVLAEPGAADVLRLLADLERTQPRLWARVSEAHLRRDGSYEIYWNDAPTVVWGQGQVSPLRLRAWAGVMEDLRQRGDLDAVVDLRLHGQILVRMPHADEERLPATGGGGSDRAAG